METTKPGLTQFLFGNPLRTAVSVVCGIFLVLSAPILALVAVIEFFALIFHPPWAPPDYRVDVFKLSDRRCGTLDKTGKLTLWPEHTSFLTNFSEGYATFTEDSLYCSGYSSSGGFISTDGKVLPLRMWHVSDETCLSSGLAPVFDPYSGKYCYVDVHGVQKIKDFFVDATAFKNGRARVCVERASNEKPKGLWRDIDVIGRFISPATATPGIKQSDIKRQAAEARFRRAPVKLGEEKIFDPFRPIELDRVTVGHGKYAPQVSRYAFENKQGEIQKFDFGNRTIINALPFADGFTVVGTGILVPDE